jgi:hypothetical protein
VEGCADAVARIGYVQNGGVVFMENGVVAVKGGTIANAKAVRDSRLGRLHGACCMLRVVSCILHGASCKAPELFG